MNIQQTAFNPNSLHDCEIALYRSEHYQIVRETFGIGRYRIEDRKQSTRVAIFGNEETRNVYPSFEELNTLDDLLLSNDINKVDGFAEEMLKTHAINELVQCDNCGWVGDIREANWATDIEKRVGMGCLHSDKECPIEECGSLVFPVKFSQAYPFQSYVTKSELPAIEELQALENDLLYGASNDIWANLEEGSVLNAEQQSAKNAMDDAASLINKIRMILEGKQSKSDSQGKAPKQQAPVQNDDVLVHEPNEYEDNSTDASMWAVSNNQGIFAYALNEDIAFTIKNALLKDTALIQTEEIDYVLKPEFPACWVEVNNISVNIKRTDEGVVVDMYPKGHEMSDSLASTYAFFNEADFSNDEI